MDWHGVVGVTIGATALGLLTYLLLWSRRTINRINDRQVRSIREIMKVLRDDR